MELREAILGRRSIRAFRAGAVPDDAIEAMKEAVQWAPSAGNIQARHFFFVTDPATCRALGDCSYQKEMFYAAALVVVGCTHDRILPEYGERGRVLYAPQDVAAAMQNLLLTVHAQGLGAVWVGAFDPTKVREALGYDRALEAVAMAPIGYPAEQPAQPEHLAPPALFTDV